jgi:chromate transporter
MQNNPNPPDRPRLTLCELFRIFFKIGLFTFGGGYAMIGVITAEFAEKRGILTKEEMAGIVVVAESTPGPIVINAATFVGHRERGTLGAAAATLGVSLPSFIIIALISLFFDTFRELRLVSYAFMGIRAGVVVVIINAIVKLNKVNKRTVFNTAMTLGAAAAVLVFGVNPVYILLSSAAIGIALGYYTKKRMKKS